MRKHNRSEHDVLSKSLSRRVSHLMVQVLSKFEEVFPGEAESPDGRRLKHDWKNAFNDVIRASRDELNDYDVHYRPLRLQDDNILAMTRTLMETVQSISFDIDDAEPSIVIKVQKSKGRVLEAIRSEFDCGMIVEQDDVLSLLIRGTDDIVKSVIPIMDKYRLSDGVRGQYRTWRATVFSRYSNGGRNG